ncbi:uncharacterized protein LOC135709125 [Ochlerotatus camptorhynchus]|uniref:uncharacterized protein LOC135709125 n=1 Tax=Ochlerotatus camptorhynchus TaxID=644619 RepID=UPI0031D40A67
METTRDRNVRIASEALRLVLECKAPQFCSSAGSVHMVQQQQEWSKRLLYTLPPLLEWIEQHRHTLFGEEWGPAVQKFQKRFVLVFLEQLSGFFKNGEFQINYRGQNAFELETRLLKFSDDVERILTTNMAIRSWLFHYYGSQLGLQGWQCRPGDLYSLYRLFDFLRHHELDVLFGQKMLSFLENIGKELLGFPQNSEYQRMGILVMTTVMQISYEKQKYTNDAEKILKMALHLNRDVGEEYGEELWSIIYYSVSSIRDTNSSLNDEVMQNLLALLNEELMKMEDDEDLNVSFGDGPLTYLRAVTLLLLLDVPEVGLKNCNFDELTISGRTCDRDKFRRHVMSHLRTNNLRFSINIRLRIAQMIPKLFAGFTSIYYVDSHAYKCLELLSWMTMFPVSRTKQQKNARGIMLKRLLEEMKLLCESFIKNPSEYSYDEQDLQELYDNLHPLLSVVREGIKQLPNAGRFRRYKCDMQMGISVVLVLLELLKCFREQEQEL